jgi:hypothetical protein
MKLLIYLVLFFSSSCALADLCAGKLIDSRNLYFEKVKIGQLQLYYNSNDGKNCALMMHSGSFWGKSFPTKVELYRCTDKTCKVVDAWDTDPKPINKIAYYKYFAGPVRVQAKGKCIRVRGGIRVNDWVNTDIVGHCGK